MSVPGARTIRSDGTMGLLSSGRTAMFDAQGTNTCCCNRDEPPPEPPPNRCPLCSNTAPLDHIYGTVASATGFNRFPRVDPHWWTIGYSYVDTTFPILPITKAGQVVTFVGAVSLQFSVPLVPPPPRRTILSKIKYPSASIELVGSGYWCVPAIAWGPYRVHSGSLEATSGSHLGVNDEYGREPGVLAGPTEDTYPRIPLGFPGGFGYWNSYIPIECSGALQGTLTGIEINDQLYIDIECEGSWFYSTFGDIFTFPNQVSMEVLEEGRSFSFEKRISERSMGSCLQPGLRIHAFFAEAEPPVWVTFNEFTPDMVSFDYTASINHSDGGIP